MSKKGLTLLKRHVPIPKEVTPSILESFPNPGVQEVRFKTDEFTSLCPVTGQPDWASIEIIYNPDKLCLESKSLKFYLQSYRNFKGFAEQITVKIVDDLQTYLKSHWISIRIEFKTRGGISIATYKRVP